MRSASALARSVSSVYCRRPSATARSASCRARATVCSASARASASSRSASSRASRQQRSGLGLGARAGLLGLLRGVVDQLVAPVQHVLGVVQLAGQRLPDVVEQLQHLAARHDAVRGHRQAPRLLDDGDQRVERFEDPVHAPILSPRVDAGGALPDAACQVAIRVTAGA